MIERKMKIKRKYLVLLSWHWSLNLINNEWFSHSQLEAYFPHFYTFTKIVIKYLQSHLSFSGNSKFKSGIEKVLRPNRTI